MQDGERHSHEELIERLKQQRREAADRVQRLLGELEVAEQRFAEITERLERLGPGQAA